VGQTRTGSVQLCIYQCSGWLSRLTVSNFSSWRKSRSALHLKSTKTVRKFDKTVMIDRILRQEHGLTIDCSEVAFLFFGRQVKIEVEDVRQVDPPRRFGERIGREYRERYFQCFSTVPAGNAHCRSLHFRSDLGCRVRRQN
jgi:hypothetical protein